MNNDGPPQNHTSGRLYWQRGLRIAV